MSIPDEWLEKVPEEDRALVRAVLEAIQRGVCPSCGSTHLQQVGRCAYCGDCQARLYQGMVRPDSDQ